MRPDAVLLLLCALIVAADAVKPCDGSLITGVTDDQIHFDSATKTLSCLDANDNSVYFKITTFNLFDRYELIKCDAVGGWTAKPVLDDRWLPIATATSPVYIACMQSCLYSRNAVERGYQYDKVTRTLKCKSVENSFMAMLVYVSEIRAKTFTSLKCDRKGRWLSGDKILRVRYRSTDKELFLDNCKKYCLSTGENIKLKAFTDETGDSVKLTCADSTYSLYYAGVQIGSNEAKCTHEGWTSSDGPLIGWSSVDWTVGIKDKPVHFECRKTPPACSFQLLPSNMNISQELAFRSQYRDDPSGELVCNSKGNIPRAIVVGSERYSYLKCDKVNGWISNDKKIADASSQLKFSCVEYCAVNPSSVTIKRFDMLENLVEASCADQGLHSLLIHDGKRVGEETCSLCRYPKADTVECTLAGGWFRNDPHATLNAPNTESLRLECKIPPCSVLDSERTLWRSDRKTLICRGGVLEDSSWYLPTFQVLEAIEVESKRYASLTCDEVEGWKDGNTKIAEAAIPLKMSCVRYCAATAALTKKESGRGKWLATHLGFSPLLFVGVGVKCREENYELINNHRHVIGNIARCSLDSGWMGSGVTIVKDVYASQHFECRLPGHPCIFEEHVVNDFTLLTVTTDPAANKITLTCGSIRNMRHEIEFVSNRFASLECNETGWKDGNRIIASALSRPNFTCVEVVAPATTATITTESAPVDSPPAPSLPDSEPSEEPPPKKALPKEALPVVAQSQTTLIVVCSAVGVLFLVIIIIAAIFLVFFLRKRKSDKEHDGNIGGDKKIANGGNDEMISSDVPDATSGTKP